MSMGPVPPFSIINATQKVLVTHPKLPSKQVVLYGRRCKWCFIDSFYAGNSDFLKLFVLITSILPNELVQFADIKSSRKMKSYESKREKPIHTGYRPMYQKVVIGIIGLSAMTTFIYKNKH